MFTLIWPIALIAISNVFYNISSKSTPANANSFLAMSITYIVAAAICRTLQNPRMSIEAGKQ